MKIINSYCVMIVALIHSVYAYHGSLQLLNITIVSTSTAIDQRNGDVMMSDKDICLLNGKGLKCEKYIKGVLLELGHCLTYNDSEGNDTIILEKCPYFEIGGRDVMTVLCNIVTSLNIKIPENLSELNNLMCRPRNRTSFLCKDCIGDFGVSYTCTSLDYQLML